jgi:ATP-dependent RNA helicase SUPV3L1/SUV3
MALLWALQADRDPHGLHLPKPGLVSFQTSDDVPHAYYYALGYRPSGARAVRIDMLERLAQQIRTARNGPEARDGFVASSQMMSLVGCSGEEFESILRSLGYRKHLVKRPPTPAAVEPAAPAAEPAAVAPPAAAEADATADAPADAPAESAPAPPPEAAPPSPPAAAEELEIAVWRMAPRRREQRIDKRPERGNGAAAAERERPERRGKPKDKKPFAKRADAPPRRFSSEPRRGREPDPNSPFAVLAALKASMTGSKPE